MNVINDSFQAMAQHNREQSAALYGLRGMANHYGNAQSPSVITRGVINARNWREVELRIESVGWLFNCRTDVRISKRGWFQPAMIRFEFEGEHAKKALLTLSKDPALSFVEFAEETGP